MSIALFDSDMITYRRVPFNLDLMKMSAYYKRQREIVILSPKLNPQYYSKFIYFKDYNDGQLPRELSKNQNIELRGLAFTNNEYQAMPLDIEKQKPDVEIYRKLQEYFSKTLNKDRSVIMLPQYINNFKAMSAAAHLRLSIDGKTVWNNWEKQLPEFTKFQNIFLHDYNLNDIDGAPLLIKELLPKIYEGINTPHIGSKFPIQVSTEKDLLNWEEFYGIHCFFPLKFNGIIDDAALAEYIEKVPTKVTSSQFEYNITGNKEITEQEVINEMAHIYLQALYSQRSQQKILLTYDEGFFSDKKWEKAIDFINAYLNINEQKNGLNTAYSFAKVVAKAKKRYYFHFSVEDVREIFSFIREENYELFRMFYETAEVELKGGKFKDAGFIYKENN